MIHRQIVFTLCFFASVNVLAAESFANLPDPTRPYYLSGAGKAADKNVRKKSDLSLESIIIAPGYRAAIINGRLLKEGQKIGRARIRTIHANRVDISRADKKQTLLLIKTSSVAEVKGDRH